MANARFFFECCVFKINHAKTTIMYNLATEIFKAKRKIEQRDFGHTIS